MTKKILIAVSFMLAGFLPANFLHAQSVINLPAKDFIAKTEISITPASGTFLEGSTFEVPIFINTKGNNINAIELHIKFDPDKLSIIKPSGGKSIIGLWVQPPTYDNSKGTAKIVGTIPGGIVSDSGLIITVTFQAKATGQAIVNISDDSSILLNDGSGSAAAFSANRGVYNIEPKAPDGVQVFSDTHPFQDHWYNDPNPTLGWNKDPGVTGFSYLLDDKPNTVPDNTVVSSSTSKSYENLIDGPWYFHIKALKQGVWSTTSTFVVRIDTAPPAAFTPTAGYLTAAVINRFLITFFTTDSLSGIDHYEVGTIDKSQPVSESPIFVQSESPYQLPLDNNKNLHVIIRAFDKAGNVRDASIDVVPPFLPLQIIIDNKNLILICLLALLILLFIGHYIFAHHVIRRIKRLFEIVNHEENFEHEEHVQEQVYQREPAPVVAPIASPARLAVSAPTPTVAPQEPSQSYKLPPQFMISEIDHTKQNLERSLS